MSLKSCRPERALIDLQQLEAEALNSGYELLEARLLGTAWLRHP
jgi:hypothetical protein